MCADASVLPRELVLRHVLLFHRHGDRAPVLTTIGDKWVMTPEELAFWADKVATKEQLTRLERTGKLVGADPTLPPPPPSKRGYEAPLGELTQKGVQHMRGKGKKLREKYGHLVADASPEDKEHVYVLSSSVPRTVQSVQCLLHGMFHDDDDIDQVVEAVDAAATEAAAAPSATSTETTVAASTGPTFHIRTYERNVLAPYHSLRVFMEIEAIVSDEVEKRAQQDKDEMSALAAHLRQALGIADDIPFPWTAVRDGLTCRIAHDLPLPEGITPEIVDQISEYDAWLWYRLYEKKEFCFKAFKYGVEEVYTHLKKIVTESPRPAPKLSFFSAHDNSIVALVSALQLRVGHELPEYGTIVAFEIYEDVSTKEHYVKVLFEDREVPFAGHEHDPLCPFKHFESLAMEFLAFKE
ncbi:Histidine acid phosphatase, partial [Globisporangium splendens]